MSAPGLADRPRLFAGRPPTEIGRKVADRRPSERPRGGRLTLEQTLDCVWEGVRADGAADCPVCSAGMAVSPDGRHATCRGCGSRLG